MFMKTCQKICNYCHISGAAIKVTMVCNAGHEENWSSSADVGSGRESIPHVNIMLIFFLFVTGLHFDQIKAFFERCNILFFSGTTYYKMVKKLLYPVIWCYWLTHQQQNLKELAVRKIVIT